MAFSTRSPVAWASASSRRRFSCSALNAASAWCALLLLLRVMDRAFGIGANSLGFALLGAFGDDGLGGVLARLVFRPVALILALRFVLPDFDVLVARNDRAAFGGFTVGGADLYQLRLGGDGLLYVRVDLRRVAFRIAARIGLVGSDFGKEQRVVAGALGAIDAGTGLGHKLRVLFRERRGGKLQQNVVLNPLLEMADGEQDALGLAAVRVRFLIAGGECFLLLFGLKLRQQKRVAHADLVLGEGFGDCRGKLVRGWAWLAHTQAILPHLAAICSTL